MKTPVALLAALPLWANPAAADVPVGRLLATAYPSGASIPENLLRVELRFASPWHSTLDMRRVRLLSDDGQEIESAFLDLPLASADGSGVAVLLHPGRVKSGVGAVLLVSVVV